MLNLLRELGNTLPTPLLAYNEKGEIFYANPACQEMTEEISEEIVGKSIFDFIHPIYWEKVKDAMKRRLAGEKGEPNSLRLKDKHGKYRIFQVMGGVVPFMGKKLGIVTFS